MSDPLDIKGLVVRQITNKEEEIVEALFLASSQTRVYIINDVIAFCVNAVLLTNNKNCYNNYLFA